MKIEMRNEIPEFVPLTIVVKLETKEDREAFDHLLTCYKRFTATDCNHFAKVNTLRDRLLDKFNRMVTR
jgi:hypothetical protein